MLRVTTHAVMPGMVESSRVCSAQSINDPLARMKLRSPRVLARLEAVGVLLSSDPSEPPSAPVAPPGCGVAAAPAVGAGPAAPAVDAVITAEPDLSSTAGGFTGPAAPGWPAPGWLPPGNGGAEPSGAGTSGAGEAE